MIDYKIKLEEAGIQGDEASVQIAGLADGLPDLLSQVEKAHNLIQASVNNVKILRELEELNDA